MNIKENLLFPESLCKPGALKPSMTRSKHQRGLCASLALEAKVNYPPTIHPQFHKQQQPWASFILKGLSVQTPFPSISKCSALAQWSRCWTCPFKNLNPGFPFYLFLDRSLDRNSHLCSSSLAPKPNSGNLSQLCPDDIHPEGWWISQVFFDCLSGISLTFSAYSPLPWEHLPPSLPPSWDHPNHHCFYAETWHSNLVFPQAKFNHLFYKYTAGVYMPSSVLVTKQTGVVFALGDNNFSRGGKKYESITFVWDIKEIYVPWAQMKRFNLVRLGKVSQRKWYLN